MNRATNAALASMAELLGEWTMRSPQFPNFRGRSKVAWMEGGAYLLVRDEVDQGEFPSGTWIVGGDDSAEDCTSLYHDSRGACRVYQMNLIGGVWKVWRNAPGFNQRFVGRLERGGKSIVARWEMSEDASHWNKDFDLFYERIEE
jgi:hypothetical protein